MLREAQVFHPQPVSATVTLPGNDGKKKKEKKERQKKKKKKKT